MDVPTNLMPSTNPATGELIGLTREHTAEELQAAVTAAREAQRAWARTGFETRKKHVLRIRDYVADSAERFSEVISRSTGKTRVDALSTEVLPAAMALTFYAKNAERFLSRRRLRGGSILTANKRSYVDRVPLGVVGIISPWNYPFTIPLHEVAMGLMAGNGIVLKVASQVRLVGEAIREGVEAGGFPPGLFSLVHMTGSEAGDAFLRSGINKLFFTGSIAVGKKLMATGAENLVPVSLELGGNDAMIVCDDADIERAVNGALWAGFSNCGQSCAGVERLFVDERIYDRFVPLLKNKMLALRQGVDDRWTVDIGSLTTSEQHRWIADGLDDARRKGATVTSCGAASESLFFPPTIVEGGDESMSMMQREIFGPVLVVVKVSSPEEAISRANASMLGLTASVWTGSRAKAHLVASHLEVGTVTINDHMMSHGMPETPWGGFKHSGMGRTHGRYGLEAMTQPRVVVDDLMTGLRRNMWWYPHDKNLFRGLLGAVDFLYSNSIARKISGGLRLARTFLRSFTGWSRR